MEWNRDGARHVAMRLGLGFVMFWFGVQELRSPSEWTVFVPSFVSDLSPIAVNDLVLLHGFLLVLAAGSVGLGLLYVPGALLAIALLAEIVFGLWYDSGFNDLVVRDIGLFGVAAALAADPSRFWRLENVLARPRTVARSSRRRAGRDGSVATGGRGWTLQAGGALGLVAVALVLGAILYSTGNGGGAPAAGATASINDAPTSSTTPAPPVAAAPTAAPAAGNNGPTPAPASTVKFNDWKYKQWSYQVYPGDISADAKKALAGFDLSIQDAGDHVVINLKALSSQYRDSQKTVAKGNTAYFVETSMRDDPSNTERNLDDDGIVVVNQDGYILRN